MQSCQVVSQSGVLTFHSGHVGLADDLITIRNVLGVDFVSIRHIKEALPETDHCPQRFKRLSTMVANNPA